MTDDLRQLEEELRQLAPRPLSGFARERILARMTHEAAAKSATGRPALLVSWGSAVVAAAAAVVLLAALGVLWRALPAVTSRTGGALVRQDQGSSSAAKAGAGAAATTASDTWRPVLAERIVLGQQETGPVYLDGRPARRVEVHYVDHLQWHDAAGNKLADYAQPHSDVVFIDYAVQ